MNEKLKKFYRDHKPEIVAGAIIVGASVTTFACYYVKINGMRVIDVSNAASTPLPVGTKIRVTLKNGEQLDYTKTIAD